MVKRSRFFIGSLLVTVCFLFGGCSIGPSQPAAMLYDLGPPSSVPIDREFPPDMPVLAVSRVSAPEWLESTMMYYRLSHVNDLQTRFYTLSRWNMPPAKLFRDRLTSRIAAVNGVVDRGKIRRAEEWRLAIHIEDFSQYFHDDANSESRIVLRASVLGKDGMTAQRRFFYALPAVTPDAPGGARALSAAADRLITEMLAWIAWEGRQEESR